VDYVNPKQQAFLIKTLEAHHKQAINSGTDSTIKALSSTMINHFEKIKETIGIRDVLDPKEEDLHTQEIFEKLRPYSPFRFRQLIRNEFDPKEFNEMLG